MSISEPDQLFTCPNAMSNDRYLTANGSNSDANTHARSLVDAVRNEAHQPICCYLMI